MEEADDSDSDDSDEEDDSDDDDDDDENDGSDDDKDDKGEDEEEGELEMMDSMQQSLSHMAVPSSTEDIEVDLERFDEMYDQVVVDQKVVSEFEKKLEERARRKGKGDENEDPDLLRDTPRLILFESEKEKKKKRGRKKKQGGSKFSKEFSK